MSPAPCLTALWTETFAHELRTFFLGRLKCPETAADLTQETYLRLHQSMADSQPDNARALAFRIAVNLVIDYQRRLAYRSQHWVEADDADFRESVPASAAADPSKILISRERYQRLQNALTELPIDCRNAFVMNRVENLGYAEIAERMNVSRSTVGRLLERAIAHCTLRLAQGD